MGKTVTPTFRVRASVDWAGRPHAVQVRWEFRHYGRPSEAALRRWADAFEASTRDGGPNAHLGIGTVNDARIIRQSTGETVATFRRTA